MKKKQSFEEALNRLEQIVGLLEQGDAPLDDALKLYEEGVALSAECSKKLTDAQAKLTELSAVARTTADPDKTDEEENDG